MRSLGGTLRPPRARASRRAARPLPALATLLALAACVPAAPGEPRAHATEPVAAPEPAELVVLVHGMGRTKLSMLPMKWALEREGYAVLNFGYSSTCCSIEELGDRLRRTLRDGVDERYTAVHLVGHSLGGILIRQALSGTPPEEIGRVVMLAPPNQGSRAADRWARWVGWLLEPLPELRTTPTSTVRSLPPRLTVDVGIIAGRDDGKVSLDETRLAGAAGTAVVPAVHSFLMMRDDVQRLVVRFLTSGSFDAPTARAGS